MTKLAALVAFAALAFSPGCKSKEEKRLDTLRDFRDRMCECKSSDCALQISLEEMKWAVDSLKSMTLAEMADAGEDQAEEKRIDAEEKACHAKLK
jgi:hypothetical protein